MALAHEPAATTRLPLPTTYDELTRLPSDGNKYELIDGSLHVTPSPNFHHQVVGGTLYRLVHAALAEPRPDWIVLMAPLDWKLDETTVLQPDLLVTRKPLGPGPFVSGPMELVVEILSPSSRLYDRNTKAAAYARAGVARYWIIDPEGPVVTVLALVDDRYEQAAVATGREPVVNDLGLTFTPADLLADLD